MRVVPMSFLNRWKQRKTQDLRPMIYLIDDDCDMLNLYQEYINSSLVEFRPVGFLGIPDALQMLELAPLPELIICDVEMPDINGLNLKELLLKKRLAIPILHITRIGSEHFDSDEHHVLSKPIGMNQFLKEVKSLLPEEYFWEEKSIA